MSKNHREMYIGSWLINEIFVQQAEYTFERNKVSSYSINFRASAGEFYAIFDTMIIKTVFVAAGIFTCIFLE